jgi:hypothetical protein
MRCCRLPFCRLPCCRLSCRVMPCHAVSCLVMPCYVLSCVDLRSPGADLLPFFLLPLLQRSISLYLQAAWARSLVRSVPRRRLGCESSGATFSTSLLILCVPMSDESMHY